MEKQGIDLKEISFEKDAPNKRKINAVALKFLEEFLNQFPDAFKSESFVHRFKNFGAGVPGNHEERNKS